MLIWPDDSTKGKRTIFNPRPKVPKTGWVLKNEFPSLRSAKAICVDVETYDPHIEDFGPGWGRGVGHIVGIAIATDDGFKQYFPIRHTGGPNCDVQQVYDYCNEQFSRAGQAKVFHNALYDLGWCSHEGIKIVGDIHDTWTAMKLIDHSASATLEECGKRYLGEGKESSDLYDWAWSYWGKGTPSSNSEKRKLAMKHIAQIPPSLVGPYAESDVDLPLKIAPFQFAEMERCGLWDVYRLECGLIPLLVAMRLAGVGVDVAAAEQVYDEIERATKVLQREVNSLAGKQINTGSAREIAPIFDKLNIKYPRTEKTGVPSFKGEFLKSVEHPIAKMIVDLEELKKYNSTFVKGFILDANINGKIYPSFNPLRAVTGRFSSSQPNAQQFPSRNELAKKIRSIFTPDVGHNGILKIDYSSVESRILASRAVGQGSDELRKQYNNNPFTDYHQFTINMVKEITGIEIQRKHAKTINFGLCIAEGQLVLTNQGLVPIEKISTRHLLWDGVEWVQHEGLINKGTKQVIEYEGLTATPDHKVWLSDGTTRTLQEARNSCKTLAVTQGESGKAQLAAFQSITKRHPAPTGALPCDDRVPSLWRQNPPQSVVVGESPRTEVQMLEDQVFRPTQHDIAETIFHNRTTLQQSKTKGLRQLRWAWDQLLIQLARTFRKVGTRTMAEADFQGRSSIRQNRQRRALLTGQPSPRDGIGKPSKYEAMPNHATCQKTEAGAPRTKIRSRDLLQVNEFRGLRRGAAIPSNQEQEHVRETAGGRVESKVYDILNAGPRRRFTCSGVLVSNCYGASEKKLSRMLGITDVEARPLFEAFHGGLPYVRATMAACSEEAQQNGFTTTVLGRRSYFNYFEPRYTPKGTDRPVALPFKQAVRVYGPDVKRAHLHKATNHCIQGDAAELMKMAMLKMWQSGVLDQVGVPRMVIHDEIVMSTTDGMTEEAFKEIKNIMETAIHFKVPIKVEAEYGRSWGETEKI